MVTKALTILLIIIATTVNLSTMAAAKHRLALSFMYRPEVGLGENDLEEPTAKALLEIIKERKLFPEYDLQIYSYFMEVH